MNRHSVAARRAFPSRTRQPDRESVVPHRHVHAPLGEEVRAIGGSCALVEERLVEFEEERVLVVLGAAQFDTSCCGAGGCAYAIVPGFVRTFRDAMDGDGLPTSLVEPITDPGTQRRFEAILRETFHVGEVRFPGEESIHEEESR
jgi:hypothetical protein